jgi:hypothetical protein
MRILEQQTLFIACTGQCGWLHNRNHHGGHICHTRHFPGLQHHTVEKRQSPGTPRYVTWRCWQPCSLFYQSSFFLPPFCTPHNIHRFPYNYQSSFFLPPFCTPHNICRFPFNYQSSFFLPPFCTPHNIRRFPYNYLLAPKRSFPNLRWIVDTI